MRHLRFEDVNQKGQIEKQLFEHLENKRRTLFLPQTSPCHHQSPCVFSCCEHFESYFCDARKCKCASPEIKPFRNGSPSKSNLSWLLKVHYSWKTKLRGQKDSGLQLHNIHLHSHLKITSVFSAKLSFEFALNSSRCQQVVYNVHRLLQGSKSAQQ